MTKNAIYIITAFLLFSCNNQSDHDQFPDTVHKNVSTDHKLPAPTVVDNLSGCFMNITGRDTLAAHLEMKGDQITGKLSFDNYQKDGSTGHVKGKLKNDIIQLIYSFSSEGSNSVMEVYFKVKDKSLVRGIGKIDVRGDTAYFVNPAEIAYTGSELERIDCSGVPSKYK